MRVSAEVVLPPAMGPKHVIFACLRAAWRLLGGSMGFEPLVSQTRFCVAGSRPLLLHGTGLIVTQGCGETTVPGGHSGMHIPAEKTDGPMRGPQLTSCRSSHLVGHGSSSPSSPRLTSLGFPPPYPTLTGNPVSAQYPESRIDPQLEDHPELQAVPASIPEL